MDSNEVVENVQSSKSEELKHLGFVKEIAMKLLVVLSNVYSFVKENSGVFKTTVDSAESAVVAAVAPLYEKVKDVCGRIVAFVDEKFDKYAPAIAKNSLVKFKSLIDKATHLVEKLLTTAQSVITPLITTVVSLVQKLLKTTKPIIQKILTTIKSAPLVGKAHTLLQKGLATTKSFLQSSALVKTAQSLLQTTLNTTKAFQDSILQKGPELANQALDTTKSIVGGIPLVGNVAQTLITNPTDLANQALDTTKSIVGGIPLVGNAAQSLITNPADLANQLVKENPVLGAVNSATQNIVREAQSTGTKAALQSAYTSFKLVAIPVIAQVWYKISTYPLGNALADITLPVIEYVSELYNKVVAYMDGKGYSISGYLPSLPIEEIKAAYKVVKTTMDGLSAVGDLAGGLAGMNDNNT